VARGFNAWTLAAVCVLLVSNGRWSVPIAIWIGPALLIHGLRSVSWRSAVGVATALNACLAAVHWYGLIPVKGTTFLATALAIGAGSTVPYAAFRGLAGGLSPMMAMLAFPCALVATEGIVGIVSPSGSWGSVAYTQNASGLLRLAGWTGSAGTTFLIGLAGSVGSWALAERRRWTQLVAGVVAIGCVAWWPTGRPKGALEPGARGVRTAMVSRDWGESELAWGLLRGSTDTVRIKRSVGAAHDSLIQLTGQAADSGALLVVWSELAALTPESQKPALLERLALVARQRGIHIVATIGTFTPGLETIINEAVVVTPDAGIAGHYVKGKPVWGDAEHGGSAAPLVQSTALGRIGVAICFDLDFPAFVRLVNAQQPDLLVVPARDWPAIGPMHSRIAAFRSAENGVGMVRSTTGGVSSASDEFGRSLVSERTENGGSVIAMGTAPLQKVATVYATFGDWLTVASTAGLIVLGIASHLSRREDRSTGVDTG